MKPLLQERTRRKIQVLPGCGRDELLNVSSFVWFSSHFFEQDCWSASAHQLKSCHDEEKKMPIIMIAVVVAYILGPPTNLIRERVEKVDNCFSF